MPFEIIIEKMVPQGWGLGRHEGKVIFVPYAAPADRLSVQIAKDKKTYAIAEILKILQPSPHRVEPLCPIFTKCGGCQWQHLDSETQLAQKMIWVAEGLKHFFPDEEIHLNPIVASPKNYFYRNRIRPHILHKQLAFFKAQSHELVPAEDCFIVEEPLRKMFQNSWPITDQPKRIELYLTEREQGMWKSLESEQLFEGFSQVNRFQNEHLVQTVVDWAQKESSYSEIWDFYCGAGNFTFPLHEKFRSQPIFGVELSAASLQQARKKTETMKSPPQFYLSSVENLLRRKVPKENSLIVLDPPRAGVDPTALAALTATKPKAIILVSCDLSAFLRDCSLILQQLRQENLKIKSFHISPFEMFPQSSHLETLALIQTEV